MHSLRQSGKAERMNSQFHHAGILVEDFASENCVSVSIEDFMSSNSGKEAEVIAGLLLQSNSVSNSSQSLTNNSPVETKLDSRPKNQNHGKLSTREATGNVEGDDHNNRTRTACSASIARKRKQSLLAERHSQMSNKTSKHRKPSLPRGRPLLTHPSAPHSLPALQEISHDKIYYNNDSSDDCNEERSDSRSNTQLRSTAQTYCRRRHKWRRNRRSTDDDEYKYNAANFKNSPHRLHEFHIANTNRPGPPKRLDN
ncbi:hypothetical protein GQ44DRAFT_797670 [Phaeosphaeriaceae sp. PMI808]|nr:hypothetical protein GQ44DRAFT_797670 [Phaeosphaeriaceae sp. PMI808]